MDLWQFLSELHPKLVHFPIVLLLAGLMFDLAGLIGRSDKCHWAAKLLTSAGTVFLLVTFICGIYAEIWAGRAGIPHHQIELHELAANFASWGFVILAAWRLLLDPTQRRSLAIYVGIGLVWYLMLVLTAHLGGRLVIDYGAGVVGARAAGALSMHDLNTLAQRQTDLNLRYSEMMHHIFGYLTLALSGSLLAAAVFPNHSARIKWVGPSLLLLGGVFLFFFADLDLYRLTDLRQWRDREVQLHKTISLILIVVGVMGLRAAYRKTDGTKATTNVGLAGRQARLVAIMALIGGGMLFTHVHTVAPYANVAAGVYVAHVTMGLVALSIGAASLLGDAFPNRRRAFAVVFAIFMCIESVLLITYNEGLPWYIGYGRYNRWGPHGGTVAPFGAVRAELSFDNETQTLDVHVLDRFKDTPVEIPARDIDVLIARGYQETAVRLHATDSDGSSHFSAHAPHLKDVPAFAARLSLPVGSSGKMKMGYFDPWVTPVIAAVPPNEVARFVCPMHEGIRSAEAGKCALCGMELSEIDASPRSGLHEAAYEMVLAAPKQSDSSDLSVMLQLTPKRDGQVLQKLAVVHEHLLHLIIVSDDLTFFDHVHPQQQADGTFTLPYKFPRAGSYLLYADITPKGGRGQVFRLPLKIGVPSGDGKANVLQASAALGKPLAVDRTTTAELVLTPRQPIAGMHAQLLFRLARNGQPVTDLRPYIGAMGHCVILSEDTQTYLHCHPEQLFAPSADATGGPDVAFHTVFPRAGKYKIWGQFRRGDEILIADFVLDVAAPPIPPAILGFFLGEQ